MSAIDPRHARAKADFAASGERQYHNMSAELVQLQMEADAALTAIDAQLALEFPVGCIVVVEDPFHPGRRIRGPVKGHRKSHSLYDAHLLVRNERTDTVRAVSARSFIYREA